MVTCCVGLDGSVSVVVPLEGGQGTHPGHVLGVVADSGEGDLHFLEVMSSFLSLPPQLLL